jgi:hypothetical protein
VNEAQIPLLHEVQEWHIRRLVLLGDRYDQSKVGIDKRLSRLFGFPDLLAQFAPIARRQLGPFAGLEVAPCLAARLDALSQPDFVLLGQERVPANLIQIEPDKILVATFGPFLRHPTLSLRLVVAHLSRRRTAATHDSHLNIRTGPGMPVKAMFWLYVGCHSSRSPS